MSIKGFPERIKRVREHYKLGQRTMAERFECSPSLWQRYEHGQSLPGAGILKRLADEDICIDWLLTGKGTMLRSDLGSLPEPELMTGLDPRRMSDVLKDVQGFLYENDYLLEADQLWPLVSTFYHLETPEERRKALDESNELAISRSRGQFLEGILSVFAKKKASK